MTKRGLVAVVLIALSLSSCTALHEEAVRKLPSGNVCVLECVPEKAIEATRIALLEMGFSTQFRDKEKVLEARKAVNSGKTTSTIQMEFGFFEIPGDRTKLIATADEKIEKSSAHIKTFWLIIIPIPYGSYYTHSIVKENMIDDTEFYQAIFDRIKKILQPNKDAKESHAAQ